MTTLAASSEPATAAATQQVRRRGSYARFVAGKTLGSVGSLFFVLVVNFFLFRVLPGDPALAVAATNMLKATDGFSRLMPSLVVVVGYAASCTALGFAIQSGLDLSTGYAMWAGLGAVSATSPGCCCSMSGSTCGL